MCGNRLKLWNTMPTSWRRPSRSTPRPDACSPSTRMAPSLDLLEGVDAAQERRLAAARRADEADHVVLVDVQVDALQHVVGAEALVHAFDLEECHTQPPARARAWRATSQSVKRASGIGHDHEGHAGGQGWATG